MSNAQTFTIPGQPDITLRTFAAEADRFGLVFEAHTPTRRRHAEPVVVDVTRLDTSLAALNEASFDVAGDPAALAQFARVAQGLGAFA